MQIELIIARGDMGEDDYRAQHMVWTIPDRTYETDWFPALVKVISGMIEDASVDAEWTISGEETEEDEQSYDVIQYTQDEITCNICGRSFASPGNLKQHKTVKHNGG